MIVSAIAKTELRKGQCGGMDRVRVGGIESKRGVLAIIYRTSEFRAKCHRLSNVPLLKGSWQAFLL